MRITLAQSAGFCFGVRRAIALARSTARSPKAIETLGEIVHNQEVTREIKNLGIKKITRLTRGNNRILLVSAHGIALKTLRKAEQLGYTIVDATCPMVKKIQAIALTMEQECRHVIIIGDKEHAEVQGIIGHLKKRPVVIENAEQIPFAKLKGIKKTCIVVQSTQNVDKVKKIVVALKKVIKNVCFYNTICATTRNKQKEIKSLPLNNDVVLIIGSKTSANTKRLYEISKSLNRRSYWVQSKNDLKEAWFKNALTVGVTSGASTPDAITQAVIKALEKFSAFSR